MRRGRALSPSDVNLIYDQGVVFAETGRTAEALKTLREALQKGYSLQQVKSDPELTALQNLPEFGKLVPQFSKHNQAPPPSPFRSSLPPPTPPTPTPPTPLPPPPPP